MKEMDNDSDGSITVEELTDAFLLRQETLTTLLVNKVTADRADSGPDYGCGCGSGSGSESVPGFSFSLEDSFDKVQMNHITIIPILIL